MLLICSCIESVRKLLSHVKFRLVRAVRNAPQFFRTASLLHLTTLLYSLFERWVELLRFRPVQK
jgi:hypothetical protein